MHDQGPPEADLIIQTPERIQSILNGVTTVEFAAQLPGVSSARSIRMIYGMHPVVPQLFLGRILATLAPQKLSLPFDAAHMLVMADLAETSRHPTKVWPADHRLTYLLQASPKYYAKLLELVKSEDFGFVAQWTSFGLQALHGSIHSYTQGLPGAGKTTCISMVSIMLVVLFKQSVVWAAHGRKPSTPA